MSVNFAVFNENRDIHGPWQIEEACFAPLKYGPDENGYRGERAPVSKQLIKRMRSGEKVQVAYEITHRTHFDILVDLYERSDMLRSICELSDDRDLKLNKGAAGVYLADVDIPGPMILWSLTFARQYEEDQKGIPGIYEKLRDALQDPLLAFWIAGYTRETAARYYVADGTDSHCACPDYGERSMYIRRWQKFSRTAYTKKCDHFYKTGGYGPFLNYETDKASYQPVGKPNNMHASLSDNLMATKKKLTITQYKATLKGDPWNRPEIHFSKDEFLDLIVRYVDIKKLRRV